MSSITASAPREDTRSTRVLVVDDHTVFTQLLAQALDHEDDLSCVGSAYDIRSGMALVESLQPDVVIMDVRLDDGDGIAATAALTHRFPDLVVVVLSAFVDAALLTRAAAAGAAALIPKSGDLDDMLRTLRTVRPGEFCVEPRLLRQLVGAAPVIRGPGLTDRELQVLRMLAAGINLGSTARELGNSLNTTRGHVKSILTKLDVHSQLEAVVVAVRRGLIDVGAAS